MEQRHQTFYLKVSNRGQIDGQTCKQIKAGNVNVV